MPRIEYDSLIIEEFAASLYRKAAAASRGSIVVGVVIGAVFGAIPLTSLGESWPIPHGLELATVVLGVLLGGYLGHIIGTARAFGYKLQAQSALCQVEIQRNSAASIRAALVQAAAAAPELEAVRNGS
jgi:uncharacterized membrane protein (UPF0136 family)